MAFYLHHTVTHFSMFARQQYDFDMTLYVKRLLRKPEDGPVKLKGLLSFSCFLSTLLITLVPLKQRLYVSFFHSEYKLPLPTRLMCMIVMVVVVICELFIIFVC
jgi:hypothetical protein